MAADHLPPLERFFAQSRDWEADRAYQLEMRARRAWQVAACACGTCVMAIGAIIVMLPLKRVIPYVYAVDRQTGELTLMDAAQERKIIGNQDLLDKHFASAYVSARDSYDWKLLQSDYDTTIAFSAPAVASAYASRFDGARAITKVWGPSVERRVTITSIQLMPDTIGRKAVVRYAVQQRDIRSNSLQPLEHYVATLSYEYHPERSGKEQDLIRNPLGFTVTGFRADPEIGGEVEGAVRGQTSAGQGG